MTTLKRRLVLKLVRFQLAVDAAHEAAAEVYEMDREFDGGEFSGPAIGRELARDEDRLARRFGFACADVAYGAVDVLRCGVPQAWQEVGR